MPIGRPSFIQITDEIQRTPYLRIIKTIRFFRNGGMAIYFLYETNAVGDNKQLLNVTAGGTMRTVSN
jgi:hypothetical protein